MKKEKLNKHIAVIHMLKCDFCDSAFTLKNQLEAHILKVHEGKKPSPLNMKKLSLWEATKPYKCSICSTIFISKRNLNKHIATIHNEQLDVHILKVHEGKKPFKCSICKTVFVAKRKLNEHIAMIHNENRSPHSPGYYTIDLD